MSTRPPSEAKRLFAQAAVRLTRGIVKIYIDEINSGKPKPLGYTKMLSYPAHFRCAMFHGWARFVPADENLESYFNNEIVVEFAQESVGRLRISAERGTQTRRLPKRSVITCVG